MSEKHIFERSSGYSGTRCTGCGAWWYENTPSTCKCDQPKPMSVEGLAQEIREQIREHSSADMATDGRTIGMLDNLIAAVERHERARVLAEFKEYAQVGLAIGAKCHAKDILAIIQSLENPNQKP